MVEKQASKQASRQASKQASKQAGKQASKQSTSEQAIHTYTIILFCSIDQPHVYAYIQSSTELLCRTHILASEAAPPLHNGDQSGTFAHYACMEDCMI